MSRRRVGSGADRPNEQAHRSLAPDDQAQPLPPKHPTWSIAAIVFAFRCAFAGVGYLLRTQRNAQIHAIIGSIALGLGFVLRISRLEWAILILVMALVLALEAVNTAIEATVDIATSSYHPLARIAKDVAAGAVLLAALAAIIIGCLIFIPPLWGLLQQVIGR